MTKNICFLTYMSGVMQRIVPFLDYQSYIRVETSLPEDNVFAELWIDAYIDLYNPKLNDPDYLYTFFLRIHKILNQIDLTKTKVRLLQNFYYDTSHPELQKVFLLYRYFTEYLSKVYDIYPIFIPDLLDINYEHHPYHSMKTQQTSLWEKTAMLRVIHPNDIVNAMLDVPLENAPYIITGMKITMLDLAEKIRQIFGGEEISFDNAYYLEVDDKIKGILLREYGYNLETIFMSQL